MVRKLFCDNRKCHRRIFTERLPQLVAPWARRTKRMTQQIEEAGLALGGAAGARLMQKQGYGFSRDTLLRCLAKLPLPAIGTLKQLGVDDFALAKGRRYGTIVVDLEQQRPIALLKDREADTLTLAQWLKQHPSIEVLSRDRSTIYRSGMNQGAPHAVQVADRFHLLQNLTEALEQALSSQRDVLKQIDLAQRLADAPTGAVVVPPSQPQPELQQQTRQRRQKRLEAYQQVWQLHQQNWSSKAIAQKVGLSTRTVQRYLLTSNFPERQGRSDKGRSLLNPYKGYLLQQYNQGRRQVKVLFWEIQKQGYKGSYKTVTRYVRQLAHAQGVTLRQYPARRRLPPVVDSSRPALTAKRAAFLVLRRPEGLQPKDQQLVQRLAQEAELVCAIGLAQDFAQLVRQRQSEQLNPWLERAEQSQLAPFERFARSLREDYAAVKAGVRLSTSNGPVEGQINRLKMLKRQMYGRAGLELLERRFLLAS